MTETSAAPSDAERATGTWPGSAVPKDTVLNGYRVALVLGQGGFGITYLAHDLLQQPFAVKEFFPRQFASRVGIGVVPATDDDTEVFDSSLARFVREAQVLLRLSHGTDRARNIVGVHTCFEANGTAYLVMQYLQGISLEQRVRDAGGRLAEAELRRILGGVLAGLDLVHEAGIAHRDVKPANVVVQPDGTPVLIDFGASREIQTTQTSGFTQIYSGAYTPPEQFTGERQGRYSDIYAVGATAYRCMGGTLVGSMTRLLAVSSGRPDPMPSAASLAGAYTPAVRNAIDRALTLEPAGRPQTAAALIALIAEAPPVPEAANSAPAASNRRRAAMLGAAGAAVLVAAIGGAWALRSQDTSVVQPTPAAVAGTASTAVAQEPPPQAAPLAVTTPPPVVDTPATSLTPAILAPPPPAPPHEPAPPVQEALVTQPPAPLPQETVPAVSPAAPCSGGAAILVGNAPSPRTIDGAFCGVLDLLATANSTTTPDSRSVGLAVDRNTVSIGQRVTVRARVPAGMTLAFAELAPSGTIAQLHATVNGDGSAQAAWSASGPPGQHLLLAIALGQRGGLGARPETERIATYLDALANQLPASGPVRAQAVLVTVTPAPPRPAAPPPAAASATARQGDATGGRCTRIIEKAQIGETLSDADLALLRGDCRR